MGEARAFMVVDVGKAEIRAVANGSDLGVVLKDIADEGVGAGDAFFGASDKADGCLLYTSPSPRDRQKSRMPSSA